MHPDDLRKSRVLKALAPATSSTPSTPMGPPPVPQRSLSTPLKADSVSSNKAVHSTPSKSDASSSLGLPQSPQAAPISPSGSRQSSLRGARGDSSESQKDLQKYTEKGEDDYDDMFGDQTGSSSLGE
jgi:hypothetical protein